MAEAKNGKIIPINQGLGARIHRAIHHLEPGPSTEIDRVTPPGELDGTNITTHLVRRRPTPDEAKQILHPEQNSEPPTPDGAA